MEGGVMEGGVMEGGRIDGVVMEGGVMEGGGMKGGKKAFEQEGVHREVCGFGENFQKILRRVAF